MLGRLSILAGEADELEAALEQYNEPLLGRFCLARAIFALRRALRNKHLGKHNDDQAASGMWEMGQDLLQYTDHIVLTRTLRKSLVNHSWNDTRCEATILGSGAVLNVSEWVNRRECVIEKAERLFIMEEDYGILSSISTNRDDMVLHRVYQNGPGTWNMVFKDKRIGVEAENITFRQSSTANHGGAVFDFRGFTTQRTNMPSVLRACFRQEVCLQPSANPTDFFLIGNDLFGRCNNAALVIPDPAKRTELLDKISMYYCEFDTWGHELLCSGGYG